MSQPATGGGITRGKALLIGLALLRIGQIAEQRLALLRAEREERLIEQHGLTLSYNGAVYDVSVRSE